MISKIYGLSGRRELANIKEIITNLFTSALCSRLAWRERALFSTLRSFCLSSCTWLFTSSHRAGDREVCIASVFSFNFTPTRSWIWGSQAKNFCKNEFYCSFFYSLYDYNKSNFVRSNSKSVDLAIVMYNIFVL